MLQGIGYFSLHSSSVNQGGIPKPTTVSKISKVPQGPKESFSSFGPPNQWSSKFSFVFIYLFFFQNSPELFREAVQKGLTSFKVSSPEWTLLQYMEDLLLAIADPPTCL